MDVFPQIQKHVIGKLQKGLSEKLTYHNVAHTLDVLKQAVAIAKKEGITDAEDMLLLKVSVLYHDTGFMYAYHDHEERSCVVATEELPAFGFTAAQIEKVCNMIRATKVPQNPQNHLEQIICDADLDYLGRPGFFETGNNLYKEFLEQGIVTNFKEWNMLQIRFLESHQYFTKTSLKRRQKVKSDYLQSIKETEGLLN
ncbi:HD domain-containing protein [Pontibacter diazotrophicus]|uniref:HD domain-containing protein n=1 Tax=Pontibacter diazotrophicus TaxID=1400979 RepID=A0A3D8LGZ7_9BACT|nr:HD domain-containing protein [Pontibacter diazotrophicus]RDV16729.1 HD domain-containing protein [Pontibacter diazotrophicus]